MTELGNFNNHLKLLCFLVTIHVHNYQKKKLLENGILTKLQAEADQLQIKAPTLHLGKLYIC